MRSTKQTGDLGETAALRALEKRGYRLKERNFRVHGGEIDLVMTKGEKLVFVEVKTRSGETFGSPFESVTAQKKRRLCHAAQVYMAMERQQPDREVALCYVGVRLDGDGRVADIEILEDAY